MRRLLLLSIIALSAMLGFATPLTPQQALLRADAEKAGMSPMRLVSRGMDLSYTFSQGDVATMYLFTPSDGAPGFLITSADDVAPAVLGYSSDTYFDASVIPENVGRWLESYEAGIVARVSSGAGRWKAAPANSRLPISPICKTRWNQGAPYNGHCPVLYGQRAVTGCVATAMAQVMKVHNWPVRGTGSNSYEYWYNDEVMSEGLDFSVITFKWDQMLNSYNGNSPQSSRDAVAELMHACGVSVNMSYSPSGSGAQSVATGTALIDYFGYDKGIRYLMRYWFTSEEWNDIVYDEISHGRPLLYSGDDQEVGHEFVCDGYDTHDFFHFNWGWGGAYDGYFILADLLPEGQGTGGGAGKVGFNYNQDIMAGVRTPQDGSYLIPSIGTESILCTSANVYSRDDFSDVEIRVEDMSWGGYTWNPGFVSFMLGYAPVTLGLKLVDGERVEYIELETRDMWLWYWLEKFEVPTMALPIGSYEVFPVCRTDQSDWEEFHVPVADSPRSLHFDVTSDKVTVTRGTMAEDIIVRYAGFTPVNGYDTGYYPGNSYDVKFKVTTNKGMDREIYAVVEAGGTVLCQSVPMEFKTEEGGQTTVGWRITIPEDATTGYYYLTLAEDVDGERVDLQSATIIAVEPMPFIMSSVITSIPVDDAGNLILATASENRISLDVTTNMPWSGDVTCRLLKHNSSTNSYTPKASSAPQHLEFNGEETIPTEWTLTIPSNVTPGSGYYLAVTYVGDNGKSVVVSPVKVKVVRPGAGIESVATDDLPAAVYYDLSGRRVEHPGRGLYIVKQGTRIFKTVVIQ